MLENLDKTKIPTIDTTIPLCTVVDLGSGDPPKAISVRLPYPDGATKLAWWSGQPSLTVNDVVEIKRIGRTKSYRVTDTDGDTVNSGSTASASFAVTNSSGATANAGDIGYIDSNGEYDTTTTANRYAGSEVAVVVGGTNDTTIYVSGTGKHTLNYTGTDPAAGDRLTTSTTAGSVQVGNGRPEFIAIATAAGSGGQVEALLHTGRKLLDISSTNDFFRVASVSSSDFTATIAALSGADVEYTLTAGNEDSIVPNATGELAKIVLHNTTRGDYALISSTDNTNTGTPADGTITLTATAPGTWAVTDVIEARSQTNTSTPSGNRFFDLEIASSEVNSLAVSLRWQLTINDSGSPVAYVLHPFETNDSSKRRSFSGQVAGGNLRPTTPLVPVISDRICVTFDASGTGTTNLIMKLFEIIVATP